MVACETEAADADAAFRAVFQGIEQGPRIRSVEATVIEKFVHRSAVGEFNSPRSMPLMGAVEISVQPSLALKNSFCWVWLEKAS